jgi:hypothetical protein
MATPALSSTGLHLSTASPTPSGTVFIRLHLRYFALSLVINLDGVLLLYLISLYPPWSILFHLYM